MAATPRPVFRVAKVKPAASFRAGLFVGFAATAGGCVFGSLALLYATFLALVGPTHGRGLMAVPIFLVPTALLLAIGTILLSIRQRLSGEYFRGTILATLTTLLGAMVVLSRLIST